MPFPDLEKPTGIAIDAADKLHVTDGGKNRVLKLAAGASAPTVLPFTGLKYPAGVAVTAAATCTSRTSATAGW